MRNIIFFIGINSFVESARTAVFSVKSTIFVVVVVQCIKEMPVYLKNFSSAK